MSKEDNKFQKELVTALNSEGDNPEVDLSEDKFEKRLADALNSETGPQETGEEKELTEAFEQFDRETADDHTDADDLTSEQMREFQAELDRHEDSEKSESYPSLFSSFSGFVSSLGSFYTQPDQSNKVGRVKSVQEIYEALRLQNKERAPLKKSDKIEEISDEAESSGQVVNASPGEESVNLPAAQQEQDNSQIGRLNRAPQLNSVQDTLKEFQGIVSNPSNTRDNLGRDDNASHSEESVSLPIAHKMQDEEHEPESMKDKRSELTSDGKKQSSKPKGIFSRVLYAIYNFFKRLINKIGNWFSKIFSRSPAKSQNDLVVRAADIDKGQVSQALEGYNLKNLGDGQNSERNLKIS